jgi:dolichol-phosphate mannosyltransferase
MRKRYVVILPTYNEKENIKTRIVSIGRCFPEMNVLVVDDNSPDGTAAVVKTMIEKEQNSKIHLIVRSSKTGLGSAYREGFNWAIENDFDWIIQMDADGSHSDVDLSEMIRSTRGDAVPDCVVGSRWIPGGSVELWSPKRVILSKAANYLSRKLLGHKVRDSTSGFRIYSRDTLVAIDFASTKSQGYAFQIEMTLKCASFDKRILEIPITFKDRQLGQSKMSFRIVLETLFLLAGWSIVNSMQKARMLPRREIRID